MSLLLAHPDSFRNDDLSAEAIRRLSILSRVAFEYAVLSIDAGWDECQQVAITASDSTVVVVRPDMVSLRRTTQLLQWAQERGVELPDRCINSAKSWLCNSKVDRSKKILPWKSEIEGKYSPIEVTEILSEYLKDAFLQELSQDADPFDELSEE